MAGRFNDCVKALWQKGSDSATRWTKEEATNFAKAMEGKLPDADAAEVLRNSPAEMREIYDKATQDHIKGQILETKLARVRDILTNQKLESAVALSDKYSSPKEFIRAFLGGIQKTNEGAKGGVDGAIKSNTEMVLNGFRQDLDKIETGSKKSAMDMLLEGDLDKRILEKKHVLDGGDKPLPKSTGNHDDIADKVAESYHKWNDYLTDRQNAQGAGIPKLQGRGTGQWNNPNTMVHGGYNKWSNFIKPLLDDRTFGYTDKDKFLRSTYDAITSGTRLSQEGRTEQAFENYANRTDMAGPSMVKERVLHFKDPQSQLKYIQSEYSHGGMGPAILNDLSHGIKNATLFEQMGTKPQAFLDNLIDRLKEKERISMSSVEADSPEWKKAKKRSDSLNSIGDTGTVNSHERRILGNITGTYAGDAHPTVSSIINAARAYFNWQTQIPAILKVLPDLAQGPEELAMRGAGNLGSMKRYYGAMMENIFKGASSSEKMLEGNEVRAFSEEMRMHLANNRWNQLGGIKGLFTNPAYSLSDKLNIAANRSTAILYKYNAIHGWDEGLMQATRGASARLLGDFAHLPHEQLPDRMSNNLKSYGINKEQWETLRKGVFEFGEDRKAITGDRIHALPEEDIKNYLKSQGKGTSDYQIDRARSELGTMINKYIYGAGYQTIMHPNAATRAVTNFTGEKNGTLSRSVTNLIMQMKGFAIQNFRTSVKRSVYGGGADSVIEALKNKNGELYYAAQKLAIMTALGAAGNAAKNYLMGYSDDKFDTKYALKMIAQSGGLGLPLEVALKDYHYGDSLGSVLAGPAFTDLTRAAQVGTSIWEGKKGAKLQAFKFAENEVPGLRSPVIRPLFNYVAGDALQNWVSPGSVQRQHKAIEKETGRKYLLPEPETSSKK
jgi:hypothetical protein